MAKITRTQAETSAKYPPKARYTPKPVTPKTVQSVDSVNPSTKVGMRPNC